ncbi:MAG: response regulator [Proteobacteria bacterium]|nr:response regulator [Pseudomonadota bacterium]
MRLSWRIQGKCALIFCETRMGSSENQKHSTGSGSGSVTLEGKPTVLVIDDEELMLEVASMMLEEEGSAVKSAANGKEGVAILAKDPSGIDCIFSDFSMPEMNGLEVYQAAQKIKPGIPFVMVSGLRIIPEVQELMREGKIQFVSKPFHKAELFKAINRARGK